MPYASRAQMKYMRAAAERGEIPKKTIEEYDKATDFSKLPERVEKKKKDTKKKDTKKKDMKKKASVEELRTWVKEAICGSTHEAKKEAIKKMLKAKKNPQ